ncbi:MAG: aminoglycoside phosphotransferase family protein [Micrococcus sp.]|nr:aminoglycoside phosphotransferase family protein [Micrococcus sp.]
MRSHVPAATAERLAAGRWENARVEESGQFHRVLILDDVAVLRMTRAAEAGAATGTGFAPGGSPAEHLPRRMAFLDALAASPLGIAVPAPLSRVWSVHDDGVPVRAAVLQPYLPGQPHPPHEGDPAVLRAIIEDLDRVDVSDPAIAEHLGEPFAFRGPWTPHRVAAVARLGEVLTTEERALLPADWPATVEAITAAVTRWHDDPPVRPQLVHGDLAGHNMRWSPRPGAAPDEVHWELHGILDWDLAHAGDPARNVAYLGVWHGPQRIEAVARNEAEAARAHVWLGAAALDSLDDARHRRSATAAPVRFTKLLRKIVPRIAAAAQALPRAAGA